MEQKIYRVGGRDLGLEQNRSRQVFQVMQARADVFTHITVPQNALDDTDVLLPKTLGQKARTKAEIALLSRALQQEKIDCFAATVQDLDFQVAKGLEIAAILERGDSREVLVLQKGVAFRTLAEGAIVLSNGYARKEQLLRLRPDLVVKADDRDLDSKLQAVEEGIVSAVITSADDLTALGMEAYRDALSFRPFALSAMVPGAGQGLLAVVCRKTDQELIDLLATHLDSKTSRSIFEAEKFFVEALGLATEDLEAVSDAVHVSVEDDDLYCIAPSRQRSNKMTILRQRINRTGEKFADKSLLKAVLDLMLGKLTYLGCDPHAPDLMSKRAKDVLDLADIVVIDHSLADVDLGIDQKKIRLLRDGANFVSYLLREVRRGQDVVRLCSDDPFLTSSASLEIKALRQEHIFVDVYPSVASIHSWPSFSGIPLLFPGVSEHYSVYSGKSFPLQEDSKIKSALKDLDPKHTLVFKRAALKLPDIVASLIQLGFDPEKPCALITKGTSMQAEVLEASLDSIAGLAVARNMVDPAILIVGGVVSLRKELKWWPKLGSMSRMHFCILHTEALAEDLGRTRLNDLKHTLDVEGAFSSSIRLAHETLDPLLDQAIENELIRSLEKKQSVRRFDRSELWLALDGVGAVHAFGRAIKRLAIDHRLLSMVNMAVSSRDAKKALMALGFEADYTEETDDVDQMAAHLASSLSPSDNVLSIGPEAQTVLPLVLNLAEIPCTNLVYAGYSKDLADPTVFMDHIHAHENLIFMDAGAVREFFFRAGELGLDLDLYFAEDKKVFPMTEAAARVCVNRNIPIGIDAKDYNLDHFMDLLREEAIRRDL